MKGKCLECENYYLVMRFTRDQPGGDTSPIEVYGCTSPDVLAANIPGGHPLELDAEGHKIKMLECCSFEPKEKTKE